MTLFGEAPLVDVLYTNNPMAGEVTGLAAFAALSATLGGKKPLLEKFTSSPAELSGVLLSVLIPTWAKIVVL
jgi:hypothetical protein